MPKVVTRLTSTQIKQAKPKQKEHSLADGDGLHLRIKPGGAKLWIFNYLKPHTKKRSNLSLGSYPAVSLAEARSQRELYRHLLSKDVDPKEHKLRQSQEKSDAHTNTLKYVADKWFMVKKTELTDSYADDLYNSLVNHVYPKLGSTPIHKITAPDTIKALEPLTKEGKQEMIKRICQRLNMIMDYAVNVGIVQHNPLSGIKKAFSTPEIKHFPSLKPEQLPMLMATIEEASITITTRCLIEWQLHTMVRPSEAAGAMWSEVNMDEGLWIIPKERMKKKRAHTVPLSSRCLNLLEVMKPLSSHREYIFASISNPRKSVSNETVNRALQRMGFKGILVSHGLRSLASTTLNEQAFDSDLIEAALAHQDKNAVRAAYNRTDYLERRKTMMQWWSDHIDQAVSGEFSLSGVKGLRAVK